MPTRLVSDAERTQLTDVPAEIATEGLGTYFDLEPGRRMSDDRAPRPPTVSTPLQLCCLRWLGFVPDNLTTNPAVR